MLNNLHTLPSHQLPVPHAGAVVGSTAAMAAVQRALKVMSAGYSGEA